MFANVFDFPCSSKQRFMWVVFFFLLPHWNKSSMVKCTWIGFIFQFHLMGEKYESRTCRFVGGSFIKRRWVTKRQMKRYDVGESWVSIGKFMKRSDPDLLVHIAMTLACKSDCRHKSRTLAYKPPQIRPKITQLQMQMIWATAER